MRSLTRSIATAAFGVLLTGAPLLAQVVNVDYNHDYPFNKMKSYSWGKVEIADAMVEPRVTGAIDRVLQSYGFNERTKNTRGDLIVTVVDVRAPQQYAAFYRNINSSSATKGAANLDWHRGWGSGGFADGTTSLRQVSAGTLVVDLYDGPTGKLVWRGTVAEAEPSDAALSKEKREGYNTFDPANTDKMVATLFANYPPKTGGYIAPNQHEVPPSPTSTGLSQPN
jgi:hypothetical protein